MRLVTWCTPLLLSAGAFLACSAKSTGTDSGTDSSTDSSTDTSSDSSGDLSLDGDLSIDGGTGTGGGGGADSTCDSVLEVTYRDFKGATEPGGHPDFEHGDGFKGQDDVGCLMVQQALGNDGKPIFAQGYGLKKRQTEGGAFKACVDWDYTPTGSAATEILSADTFSTWYRTTEGTNLEISGTLQMSEEVAGSGLFVFDSNATGGFFPIDGQGFGNTPGWSHNYSFTTEAHAKFGYVAGQKFTFRGDDDLWVFVNGKLALDLGGMHGPIEATIDFDAQASALGISPGNTYQMDIYHAERQTDGSNFRVETNIKCFQPAPVPVK